MIRLTPQEWAQRRKERIEGAANAVTEFQLNRAGKSDLTVPMIHMSGSAVSGGTSSHSSSPYTSHNSSTYTSSTAQSPITISSAEYLDSVKADAAEAKAELERLRAEIASAHADIEARTMLATELDEKNCMIGSMKEQIVCLEEQIAVYQEEMNDLESDCDSLANVVYDTLHLGVESAVTRAIQAAEAADDIDDGGDGDDDDDGGGVFDNASVSRDSNAECQAADYDARFDPRTELKSQ